MIAQFTRCNLLLECVSLESMIHLANVDEFTFRLNEGNVENHTLTRLDSFVDATVGKRLTYARLTA